MCDDGMFRDFPDIRWVVAHAGGAVPYLMERKREIFSGTALRILNNLSEATSA
jgi:predicted TIM-barrel fold metal-dependent hydrolase